MCFPGSCFSVFSFLSPVGFSCSMFEVLFWPSFLLMTFYVHPSVSCIWFQSPAMQHNMTEPWPLPLPCLSLAVINKATFMPGLAISLSPVRQLPMLFLIVQLTSSLQSRAGFFTTVSSPHQRNLNIHCPTGLSPLPAACSGVPPPQVEKTLTIAHQSAAYSSSSHPPRTCNCNSAHIPPS